MRVDEKGNQLNDSVPPTAPEVETEEIERYDSAEDYLSQLFALFLNVNYASVNPEISIAARILSRMKKVAIQDPRVCPMMAVTIQDQKHMLLYNEAWMAQASFAEITATLVHEAYHIVLRDIPRFLRRMSLYSKEERGAVHQILNVALDAANNDLIRKRMPHMKYGTTGYWVLPEETSLKNGQPSEHYLEILLQRARQSGKEGAKGGLKGFLKGIQNNPDSSTPQQQLADAAQKLLDQNAHDWTKGKDGKGDVLDKMSPDEVEALAAELEDNASAHVKKALQDHEKRHGTLPGHLQEVLDSLLAEAEIPWTRVLQQLVSAQVCAHRIKTPVKAHKNEFIYVEEDENGELHPREFPLPVFPGEIVDTTFTIMFAIDTSGSMSAEDVKEGLAEIQGMIRTDPNIHVIVVQADTQISHVDILSPDMSLDDYMDTVGITGRGGTDFNKPFALLEYIHGKREHPPVAPEDRKHIETLLAEYNQVDLVVYHTDGFAPSPSVELEPACPVIWCLPKNNATIPGGGKNLFGKVVAR